jgi:hypothetical protein
LFYWNLSTFIQIRGDHGIYFENFCQKCLKNVLYFLERKIMINFNFYRFELNQLPLSIKLLIDGYLTISERLLYYINTI